MMRSTAGQSAARSSDSSAAATKTTRAPQSLRMKLSSATVCLGFGVATATPASASPSTISIYSRQFVATIAARSPLVRPSLAASEATLSMRSTSWA